MATIIYCHGLASVGNSEKSELLRCKFPDDLVLSPDIPVNPVEALEVLEPLILEAKSFPVILVGTSLGGFWAHYLSQVFDVPCVIVNPCTRPSSHLAKYVGDIHFRNYITAEHITITEADLLMYKELEEAVKDVRNGALIRLTVTMDDDVINYKDVLEDIPFSAITRVLPTGGHRALEHWPSVMNDVQGLLL